MDIDFNKCYKDLQIELDNAKSSLHVLNDSVRRVLGRPIGNGGPDQDGSNNSPKYGHMPKPKRLYESKQSVFSRLAAHDEPKPRLSSRVIRDLPTREEVLEAQGSDMESRARNRRMFGSLLGTLHKFCLEETRLKQKEDKKAQIEKKLEEQQSQEREMLRRERDSLLTNQKNGQQKIKTLELKIDRLKDFTAFESAAKNYRNCIRTKTKPHIFYRPYKLCKKTEKLLASTREALDKEMKNRKTLLSHELKYMDLEGENGNVSVKDPFNGDKLVESSNNLPNKQNVEQKEAEFKENKLKYLNEPALSSSIVVVKKD